MKKIGVIFLLLILSTPCWGQMFTGDGGRGKSIAILSPRASGLTAEQQYIPDLVQGEFVSNFNTYTAIKVLDRVTLERQYAELLSGYYNDNAGGDLGHLIPTDYLMVGNITRTSTGFALQIQITRDADKTTAASYSQTVTFDDLDNLTGIRRASLDLLQRLGITPTQQARIELTRAAAASQVNAQTALARGINAQRQGTEVAALSYYFQAAAFDPSLAEAANRSSILAANISSGNIGDDARNEIAWRNAWVARLKETEQYFNSYFNNLFRTAPILYTLFYASDIKQIGGINFQNETVTLGGMETNLRASQVWAQSVEPVLASMQRSVQAVLDGLNKTGRKTVWGLDNWPQQGSFNLQPFGRQSRNFTIAAELVNSRGLVIGRQTFQTAGTYEVSVPLPGRGAQRVQVSADDKKTVNFPNVKANDITDTLTIRIASVNGTAAETAARSGVLQITPIPKGEFDLYGRFNFTSGVISGYTGSGGTVAIPGTIWGEPVTSAGRGAFGNNPQFTRITTPANVNFDDGAFGREFKTVYDRIGKLAGTYERVNDVWLNIESRGFVVAEGGSITEYVGGRTNIEIPPVIDGIRITAIGKDAFKMKKLTRVTIPDSVTRIEDSAFFINELTSVTIPNGVTSIGQYAFYGNRLTSVTIPDGVTKINKDAFSRNSLTSVTIPDSVTEIGDYAFSSNELTSVTIPDSVTKIGDHAFEKNKLTSVTIPNSVTAIGYAAFIKNPLTSITIGANVAIEKMASTHSGEGSFYSFPDVYNKNRKKAGVYTFNGKKWSYRAQ